MEVKVAGITTVLGKNGRKNGKELITMQSDDGKIFSMEVKAQDKFTVRLTISLLKQAGFKPVDVYIKKKSGSFEGCIWFISIVETDKKFRFTDKGFMSTDKGLVSIDKRFRFDKDLSFIIALAISAEIPIYVDISCFKPG